MSKIDTVSDEHLNEVITAVRKNLDDEGELVAGEKTTWFTLSENLLYEGKVWDSSLEPITYATEVINAFQDGRVALVCGSSMSQVLSFTFTNGYYQFKYSDFTGICNFNLSQAVTPHPIA